MANDKKNGEMIQNPGIEGFQDYQDEQTGLPPYWGPNDELLGPPDASGFRKPTVPMQFYGKVVSYDDSDPEFKRYVIQAGHDILCKRGAKDVVEEVQIKKYEFFSVSDYAGLPLGRYIGLPVFAYIKGKRPIVSDRGIADQTVWEWGIKVSPQVKAKMDQRREKAVAEGWTRSSASNRNSPPPTTTKKPFTDSDDDIPF